MASLMGETSGDVPEEETMSEADLLQALRTEGPISTPEPAPTAEDIFGKTGQE